jgi:undecaprenyl-diphosphatase
MAKKSTKPVKPEAQPEQPPPPEQQLGDTPVAPWEMPTPAEKAAAQPVREALQEALNEVDSPAKAEQVLDELESTIAEETVGDVVDSAPAPASATEAAQQVQEVVESAPSGECAAAVLKETARVVSGTQGREREVIAEAAQEILNPQQQGEPAAAQEKQRKYLRQAVLKRLQPLDALDAEIFLSINHLPHPRFLNRFFYTITYVFTGGVAWLVWMAAIILFNRPLGLRIARNSVAPLILATSIVEYPIKAYFRRRRPFITMIQAIVIGKKPGTWSFPSGHSATAFAGAWLLSHYLPKWRSLFYTLASLVAFSRIYLGDHYPGDVVSGSVSGWLLARFFHRLPWPWKQAKPGK